MKNFQEMISYVRRRAGGIKILLTGKQQVSVYAGQHRTKSGGTAGEDT